LEDSSDPGSEVGGGSQAYAVEVNSAQRLERRSNAAFLRQKAYRSATAWGNSSLADASHWSLPRIRFLVAMPERNVTNTFILLLRAVNVAGANSMGTKDFVRLLESMGLKNVKTYIQTGNAVFSAHETEAAALPEKIKARIRRVHGFAPEVILLRLDELEGAIASNPYPGADSDPKALHLTFLAVAPKTPDLSTLEKFRKDSEHYSLKGRAFYFWAPEGVGRSKLFSRIEKSLGVPGTARNWRTVCKLLELAREITERKPSIRKTSRKS
jgi:uncharacterized protein (DUF1697 family)